MNKYISMILIVAMLIITSSISFATDVIEGEQLSAEAIADTVEEVVDTDAINTNFDIKKSVYKIKGEGIDIHIPVKGKDPVITQIDGDESIVKLSRLVDTFLKRIFIRLLPPWIRSISVSLTSEAGLCFSNRFCGYSSNS